MAVEEVSVPHSAVQTFVTALVEGVAILGLAATPEYVKLSGSFQRFDLFSNDKEAKLARRLREAGVPFIKAVVP